MCLACGSARAEPWATAWDAEYLTTDARFAYHRCLDCGALFIDPVPADRLSAIYPANYYAFTRRGSLLERVKDRVDARLFRWALREVAGTRVAALDVGGGAGQELSRLRALDPRVAETVVVDFSPDAAEPARREGHTYVGARIEAFETDRRFDVVLLLNLIEHVATPAAVLRKVRSLLSPHGVVLVKTPNHDSLDARLFRHANWGGYHCPRHWVLFTRESFTALARRAGLEVRRFAYTQGAPFWALSVLFQLAARGVVAVTPERPAVHHPLSPLLTAGFAAFDFARRPLAKTSQMVFLLGRDGA